MQRAITCLSARLRWREYGAIVGKQFMISSCVSLAFLGGTSQSVQTVRSVSVFRLSGMCVSDCWTCLSLLSDVSQYSDADPVEIQMGGGALCPRLFRSDTVHPLNIL